MEKKLKDILERELAYIEERTEWEKGAKDFFGDKMGDTLKEINKSRQEALLSDTGNDRTDHSDSIINCRIQSLKLRNIYTVMFYILFRIIVRRRRICSTTSDNR